MITKIRRLECHHRLQAAITHQECHHLEVLEEILAQECLQEDQAATILEWDQAVEEWVLEVDEWALEAEAVVLEAVVWAQVVDTAPIRQQTLITHHPDLAQSLLRVQTLSS